MGRTKTQNTKTNKNNYKKYLSIKPNTQ